MEENNNENYILQKVKEEIELGSHQQRIFELKQRMALVDEQQTRLSNYLRGCAPGLEDCGSKENLTSGYGYEMKCPDDYTVVTQGNLPYCQLCIFNNQTRNLIRIPARVYRLRAISERFYSQLVNESLKIWRYFCDLECWSGYGLKVYDMLKTDACLYVFHERFQAGNSLKHRLWNGDNLVLEQMPNLVKGWTLQLADALDMLNTAGVAHRFVRPENILIGSDQQVKLTSFDLACLCWNVEERCAIRQSRGLPTEINRSLLDHLPPECFDEDGYDASMVDVWSLGTVVCELLTRNNPLDYELVSPTDPGTALTQQWPQSTERKLISEDFRTLLDDVFKDFDNRLTIFDLKKDIRLRYPCSVLAKVKPNPYYRIDLNKNLNVNEIDLKRTKSTIAKQLSWSEFGKNCSAIFNLPSFKVAPTEDSLPSLGFQVRRASSFTPEFSTVSENDFYLKATVHDDPNCLAKIYLMARLPIRHRNMLMNESTKIMRYFSEYDQSPAYIHRILDIYFCETKLFVFYENLLNYRTMAQIVRQSGIKSSSSVPANYRQWMAQLSDLVNFMTYHGVSHRYVRPEYVFITESGNVKLAHFDMACFVWNPNKLIQVLRHRGLQDEQTQLWDHLAPECFDEKYDSLLVDVWSLGVLLVYCLTKEKPFMVPFNCEEAQAVWRYFRSKFAGILHQYLELLDKIFTNYEQRIRPSMLAQRLALTLTNNSNNNNNNNNANNNNSLYRKQQPISGHMSSGTSSSSTSTSSSSSSTGPESSSFGSYNSGSNFCLEEQTQQNKTFQSLQHFKTSITNSSSSSSFTPSRSPPPPPPKLTPTASSPFKPVNHSPGSLYPGGKFTKPQTTTNSKTTINNNQLLAGGSVNSVRGKRENNSIQQGHQQLLNSVTKAIQSKGTNNPNRSRSKLHHNNRNK